MNPCTPVFVVTVRLSSPVVFTQPHGHTSGPYPEVDAGGVTAGVTACSKLPRHSGGCSIYKIYIFLWHPGGRGYRNPTSYPHPHPGYGPALRREEGCSWSGRDQKAVSEHCGGKLGQPARWRYDKVGALYRNYRLFPRTR